MLTPDSPTPSPRPRLTDDTRRQVVGRFQRSGLTQRAFCEQAGLPVSTLQWWLVKTRRETAPHPPMTLTEIRMPELARADRDAGSGWAVEIVTRTGVTLRLRDPLRPAALRLLLRGARC